MKLTRLPDRLQKQAPRLASIRVDGERAKATGAHWRAWYHSKRWQRLRWQVLREALFTCARCGRVEASRNLVADHVRPHRGDAALFWDRGNLQCLCSPCHASAKQREEAAGPWAG